VKIIFDGMTNALAKGERVEIRGFGSFKVKSPDKRYGNNTEILPHKWSP
jgi:nucleoid DNA-binding protein